MDMRAMRMEREDIENSLKVLSHIVDDDFIITVDEARKIIRVDGETIEALQANIKRLKETNNELREAQTYIDHYGDTWMTSAKDVPTAAYEHGYFDGKVQAEQQLEPKRGKWIRIDKHTIQCSLCHRYLDLRGVNAGRGDANYCPNCGAKMEA